MIDVQVVVLYDFGGQESVPRRKKIKACLPHIFYFPCPSKSIPSRSPSKCFHQYLGNVVTVSASAGGMSVGLQDTDVFCGDNSDVLLIGGRVMMVIIDGGVRRVQVGFDKGARDIEPEDAWLVRFDICEWRNGERVCGVNDGGVIPRLRLGCLVGSL